MKVTAQWIAEQCGVSRGTVDRVVNGRPNVAPEVRERVQKIISEYGYNETVNAALLHASDGLEIRTVRAVFQFLHQHIYII